MMSSIPILIPDHEDGLLIGDWSKKRIWTAYRLMLTITQYVNLILLIERILNFSFIFGE